MTEENIQLALAVVILVVLMLTIDIHRDTLRRRAGVDRFASEKEKLDRAQTLVDKTASAFRSNPDMSFDQFKEHIKDGDAVEYKDMRASGGRADAAKLASNW